MFFGWFFLVREMNSWPLMLILWYARRRREDLAPLSSLFGALLCHWGRAKKKKKKWHGELGIQADALSTLYFLWLGPKVSLLVLPLRLLPSSPSSFLSGPMATTLPPPRGVIGLQSLLLAASPVDTVVMSLPFGSTNGHPRPPQWAASLVYSFGEWGGMSHGGTVRRYDAEPPRLPLSTPQQRSLTLGLSRNGKIKKKKKKRSAEAADFIHLPDFEPKPLCHSAPTDKLSDQHENTVRTTTKDARFHLTRITHQHPCNKLNY